MIEIEKWRRFFAFSAVMLTIMAAKDNAILCARAEQLTPDTAILEQTPEREIMGCVVVTAERADMVPGTISLKLEHLETGQVREQKLCYPYRETIWLPEGCYQVTATLPEGHDSLHYPREIAVSRYQQVLLLLTATQEEISAIQEKQGSFIPQNLVPYGRRKEIWGFLMDMTGNAYAAAGVMGNLYAESALDPENLQDVFESTLHYSDRTYTEAVDTEVYSNFASDGAGYGLAQWTWQERKENLLEFAQQEGASIGNLECQLRFLHWELESRGLLERLQGVKSVEEASDLVLFCYEAPLDQSLHTQILRRQLSGEFYRKFAEKESLSQIQRDVLMVAKNCDRYGIPNQNVSGVQWGSMVLAAAGVSVNPSCCAYHMSRRQDVRTDWNALPPGSILYGYCGSVYGHAGIYLGDGTVAHCDGQVQITALEEWISQYKGFGWEWQERSGR